MPRHKNPEPTQNQRRAWHVTPRAVSKGAICQLQGKPRTSGPVQGLQKRHRLTQRGLRQQRFYSLVQTPGLPHAIVRGADQTLNKCSINKTARGVEHRAEGMPDQVGPPRPTQHKPELHHRPSGPTKTAPTSATAARRTNLLQRPARGPGVLRGRDHRQPGWPQRCSAQPRIPRGLRLLPSPGAQHKSPREEGAGRIPNPSLAPRPRRGTYFTSEKREGRGASGGVRCPVRSAGSPPAKGGGAAGQVSPRRRGRAGPGYQARGEKAARCKRPGEEGWGRQARDSPGLEDSTCGRGAQGSRKPRPVLGRSPNVVGARAGRGRQTPPPAGTARPAPAGGSSPRPNLPSWHGKGAGHRKLSRCGVGTKAGMAAPQAQQTRS